MSNLTSKNIIDCSDLSKEQINYQIKDLIFNKTKNVILKNTEKKQHLLEGLKGDVKLEIIGDVGSYFANEIDGLKIIVNGNIGDNSACNIKNSKITVFGSCGGNFGSNSQSGEFYVLENCGQESFLRLNNKCKVVIGGQPSAVFAAENIDGTIVVLNLKGGNIFLDDSLRWLEGSKSGFIYIRGECKINAKRFLLEKTNEKDEDLYLPLISEFARLFKCSLSEIKSKPFYRINFK